MGTVWTAFPGDGHEHNMTRVDDEGYSCELCGHTDFFVDDDDATASPGGGSEGSKPD